MLCKTLIQPRTTYGIELWGSTYMYVTNMTCILLIHKMAIRAMIFGSILTPSKPLFNELKLQNVYQLHELSVCVFMYQLLNNRLPHSSGNYFSYIEHRYGTRQRENRHLQVPKVRTTLGKFSMSYRGVEFWNVLPIEIRGKSSVSCFRKTLMKMMLNK